MPSGTVPDVPEPVPEQAELCLPRWVSEFDGQPIRNWEDDTEARPGTDPEHVAAILDSFRHQNRTGWVQGWVILRLYPEICWAAGLAPLTNRQLLLALGKMLRKAKRRLNGGRPVTCYFVPAEPENVACVAERAPRRAAVARDNVLPLPTARRSGAATQSLKSQAVTSRGGKPRKGGGPRIFGAVPAGAFVSGPASAGASA
ncbi:MAG TPA: hypothetical protein VNK48_14500 [Xanthobacteraceae bacterium]|nr:hypothetical protein [Xanthobacteraceae bacterium]